MTIGRSPHARRPRRSRSHQRVASRSPLRLTGAFALVLVLAAIGWSATTPIALAASHATTAPGAHRPAATGSDDSFTVMTTSPNPSNALQNVHANISVFDTSTSCSLQVSCDHPLGFVEIDVDGGYVTSVPLAASAADDASTAGWDSTTLAVGSHTVTAAYQGDVTFAPSSADVTQVVNLLTTTTALAQSTTSGAAGDSVTFTATVSGTGGSTPTGQVQFYDAGSPYGSPVNLVGPSAALTTSLAVGPHTFTARYLGDDNDDQSVSNQVVHPVSTAGSITELSTNPNPSACHQRVTLQADVLRESLHGPTPTGTVTFFDGATPIATVDLVSGTATTFITALTPGSHDLTATYNGDGNFDSSSSLVVTQVVNACTTPVAVADSYTTPTNTALAVGDIGVLGNDLAVNPAAPDGASLQSGVGHGSLTLAPAGGFSYTPTTDFVGADSFTYCVSSDPDLLQCDSNVATVSITVTDPNATTTTAAPTTTTTTVADTTTSGPTTTVGPTTTTTAASTTTVGPTTSSSIRSTTTSAPDSSTTDPTVAGAELTNSSTTTPPPTVVGATTELPVTGADSGRLFALGVLLLTGGALATLEARRRIRRLN